MSARAEGRCEYCRIDDDDFAAATVFQEEHIVPQVSFDLSDDARDDLDNLAWSCPVCNRRKWNYTDGYDAETQQTSRLFDPRSDSWETHFSALPSGFIVGTTAVGRATEDRLRFNEPKRITNREALFRLGRWP